MTTLDEKVTLNYFDFHMHFRGKRIFTKYGKQIDRPFLWKIAFDNGYTYGDIEKNFDVRRSEK